MTLNAVMAVILPYISEFGYLPGVLLKSSRSLYHLLMSSCHYTAIKALLSLKVTSKKGKFNGNCEKENM